METVFKVGMKVYDQIFFPDVEGKIIEVHNKNDKTQLEVKFFSKYRLEPLCMQSSVFYTENGNMINFLGYNCGTSTLSTSPYNLEMQGFEQKAPAPTYEKVVRNKNYIYLPENLVAPNKELADATIALLKLLFLRDYYNEGWQPDWKDSSDKCCITLRKGKFIPRIYYFDFEVLHFKSIKIRDKFLEEQKELLEIAKPLL